MTTIRREDLAGQLQLRMDVLFRRQPQENERDLIAVIERSLRKYAAETGRPPAFVLAVGASAAPDEVRQAMEAIA
jgi:hypothetical protein